LLPALPVEWPDGEVKGLVARGGFVIDMVWKDGTLSEAFVTAKAGGTCRIKYKEKIYTMSVPKGKRLKVPLR
jgi:alpha-L-fucosidase 2